MLTVYHAASTLFNMLNGVQVDERTLAGGPVEGFAAEAASKSVKSAARTLDILELLGRAESALTLSEIAAELSLPKSSTYLLLQTLVHRGYLEAPTASGPFQLGIKVIELAGGRASRMGILQQFPPVARSVVGACQETVQLAVRDGTEIVYLAKQDGTRPVRLVSSVGRRLPAHCAALGKVLLASLPDTQLSTLYSGYSFAQMTPRTIASFDGLMREISRVRADNCAIDDEEAVEDLQCFAAPVRDAGGRVIAAISVSVPKTRVAGKDMASYVTLIKNAGSELSRRLGHNPPI